MAVNSLWRALKVDGFWHRVIKSKYFTSISIESWLRIDLVSRFRCSPTWKYLTKTFHLLVHGLSWRSGIGSSIHIGKDQILGLGLSFYLSDELIQALNHYGIHFLFQACCLPRLGFFGHNWLTCIDLNLGGSLATQWQNYRKFLINSGIQLTQRTYALHWLGGDRSGKITVKNAYEVIE